MKTRKVLQHPTDQPTGHVCVSGEPRAWALDHPVLPPAIEIDPTADDYRTEPAAASGEIYPRPRHARHASGLVDQHRET